MKFEKHRRDIRKQKEDEYHDRGLMSDEEYKLHGKALDRDAKRLKNVTRPKSLITPLDL
jgi:hypothetical protein